MCAAVPALEAAADAGSRVQVIEGDSWEYRLNV